MLSNLTIRRKLIMAFSVLIALMIVIFSIATYRFREINVRVNEITDVTAHKVLLIGQIKHDITAISRDQKIAGSYQPKPKSQASLAAEEKLRYHRKNAKKNP